MRAVVGVLVLLAASVGVLRLPGPLLWLCGLWASASALVAARCKPLALRAFAVTCAALALVLAAWEGTLLWREARPSSTRFEGSYVTQDLWLPHPTFGYGPKPGLAVEATRLVAGEPIYTARYTYDAHGLRQPPPVSVTPPAGAVLCFGGSFTLGEGVADERAYPYRVGVLSEGRYEVLNFGFHGYGPHHSLAALQEGVVDRVRTSEPVLALYLAISDHVARAAGCKSWDREGPRYVLGPDGLQRAGRFSDARPTLFSDRDLWLRELLRRTAIGRKLRGDRSGYLHDERARYEAVVLALRDEVRARYPGASFHVLAWEGESAWLGTLTRLGEAGVPVHHVRAMLPDLAEGQRLPTLPGDPHPTPEVYEAIARYVATQLLR